jgi:hypothetical protein
VSPKVTPRTQACAGERARTCMWVFDDAKRCVENRRACVFVRIEDRAREPGDPYEGTMFLVNLCDEHWEQARSSLGRETVVRPRRLSAPGTPPADIDQSNSGRRLEFAKKISRHKSGILSLQVVEP